MTQDPIPGDTVAETRRPHLLFETTLVGEWTGRSSLKIR